MRSRIRIKRNRRLEEALCRLGIWRNMNRRRRKRKGIRWIRNSIRTRINRRRRIEREGFSNLRRRIIGKGEGDI